MAEKFSPRKVRFRETQDSYFSEENRHNEACLDEEMFGDTTISSATYGESWRDVEKERVILDAHVKWDQKAEQDTLNSSDPRLLYNQKRRFSSTTSLNRTNGSENKKKISTKTLPTKRRESGIQRLEYELSNLKSRLFDTLQEYEDFKDSFPGNNFPAEWEPQPVRDLRSKVSRLSKRVEREKNKLKLKANDEEIRKMIESLLDHCGDENFDDDLDPLEKFTVSKIVENNTSRVNKKKLLKNNMEMQRKSFEPGLLCKVPEELKTRQRRLFRAGDIPPRAPSELEASQAALHCALSRLPPLSRRIGPRKFGRISPNEAPEERRKLVLIPNKRRLVNGRAFIHERQKEFISFHKSSFHRMDVSFVRTAFESFN